MENGQFTDDFPSKAFIHMAFSMAMLNLKDRWYKSHKIPQNHPMCLLTSPVWYPNFPPPQPAQATAVSPELVACRVHGGSSDLPGGQWVLN